MLLKEMIQSPKTGRLCLKPKFELLFKNRTRVENFIHALEKLNYGYRMTRLSWIRDDAECDGYVYIKNGLLLHNKPYHPDQKPVLGGYPYVMTYHDVYLDDWISVDYHTREGTDEQ